MPWRGRNDPCPLEEGLALLEGLGEGMRDLDADVAASRSGDGFGGTPAFAAGSSLGC